MQLLHENVQLPQNRNRPLDRLFRRAAIHSCKTAGDPQTTRHMFNDVGTVGSSQATQRCGRAFHDCEVRCGRFRSVMLDDQFSGRHCVESATESNRVVNFGMSASRCTYRVMWCKKSFLACAVCAGRARTGLTSLQDDMLTKIPVDQIRQPKRQGKKAT